MYGSLDLVKCVLRDEEDGDKISIVMLLTSGHDRDAISRSSLWHDLCAAVWTAIDDH